MLRQIGKKLGYGSAVGLLAASALLSAACSSAATAATSQTKTTQSTAVLQTTQSTQTARIQSTTQPTVSQALTSSQTPGNQTSQPESNTNNKSGQSGKGNLSRQGTLGTLSAVDGTTLTLETVQGSQITVVYSSDTTLQKTVSAAISDLITDEQVMVSGTLETDGTLTASSIRTGSSLGQGSTNELGGMFGGPGNNGGQPTPNGDQPADVPTPTSDGANMRDDAGAGGRSMVTGTISSLGTDSIVVKTQDGSEVTVNVTSDTKIQQTLSASAADLVIGTFLMAQGTSDSDGTVTATAIAILPEGIQILGQTRGQTTP
jgi:hypothetical protein